MSGHGESWRSPVGSIKKKRNKEERKERTKNGRMKLGGDHRRSKWKDKKRKSEKTKEQMGRTREKNSSEGGDGLKKGDV